MEASELPRQRFRISWVLIDELAVGPAPAADRHLQRLEDSGIRSILSLCSVDEAPPPNALSTRFQCDRIVLPDHRSGHPPVLEEVLDALTSLQQLRTYGPVFVHCVAAMERSPLICLAWLVREHQLEPQAALDYLMQVHPGTNPLPAQLVLLHHPSLQNRSREDR